MKTVYVVTYWLVGECDGISGIFDEEYKAVKYATLMQGDDEDGHDYYVQEWEVQ